MRIKYYVDQQFILYFLVVADDDDSAIFKKPKQVLEGALDADELINFAYQISCGMVRINLYDDNRFT